VTTFVATAPCVLRAVPRAAFLEVAAQNPELGARALAHAERVEATLRRAREGRRRGGDDEEARTREASAGRMRRAARRVLDALKLRAPAVTSDGVS
jgi:CRP-like cAMP-binding protein